MSDPHRIDKRTPRENRRGGYVMVIVLAMVLSAMALATLQMRYLDTGARIERAAMESAEYSSGPLSVLAIAIGRLQTGDPPMPVQYAHSHEVDGVTTIYRISYSRSGDQWEVVATPDPTAALLPPLPADF